MKLIVAVVQDQDKNILSDAFYEADIRATKLSSTGGFLRSGNTTFIVGIEEERVDEVLDIIKQSSQSREQFISSPVNLDVSLDVTAAYPVKVKVGGATVFVLPIDAFHQF
ncbi:TPA: cyclic-di-AMP receptor [Streptococcus suis]